MDNPKSLRNCRLLCKGDETLFTHPHILYVLKKEGNQNGQGEGTGKGKAKKENWVCSAVGPFPQHLKVSLGPLHLPCLPS